MGGGGESSRTSEKKQDSLPGKSTDHVGNDSQASSDDQAASTTASSPSGEVRGTVRSQDARRCALQQ